MSALQNLRLNKECFMLYLINNASCSGYWLILDDFSTSYPYMDALAYLKSWSSRVLISHIWQQLNRYIGIEISAVSACFIEITKHMQRRCSRNMSLHHERWSNQSLYNLCQHWKVMLWEYTKGACHFLFFLSLINMKNPFWLCSISRARIMHF